MTENFKDKLRQEECKQSKGAKICASIRRELDCEKCSKTFCQIFAGQNMQNQANANQSINSENIFKSIKNVLENVAPKKTTLTLPHLNFQAKFVTERTLIVVIITVGFPWLKVLYKLIV